MQWNHPQSAHVPLLSAPTGYTKYLLPVSGCWLSSFICHPKNMHSSGVCSWLLHASLMLASVDILPPARKPPPLTPIHCQYDHRRPNPQRLSNICGVWINHCYSSRKMIDHVDVHRCRQKIAIKWNDCFLFGKYKATAVKPSTLVDVCGGWWMISSPPSHSDRSLLNAGDLLFFLVLWLSLARYGYDGRVLSGEWYPVPGPTQNQHFLWRTDNY